MRHKALYPGILVLAVLALSSLFVIGPRLGTKAQSTTACCGTNPPTAPREIIFPYYSLADGFNSTLLLVSDSPDPLNFVLAIHSLSGQTQLSNSMAIQPGAKLPIDMRSLLTSRGADVMGTFAQGSVSVYFEGTIMPLVGQMTIENPARHWVQQAEMVENDPGRSDIPAVLSGQWWGLAGGRDATIMVTNASAGMVTADVLLAFGGKQHKLQPLVFNPNETKPLSVAGMLATLNTDVAQAPEGRITIIQQGSTPSLVAQGRVTDPVTGFSTTLEFPDPARQHASALHASGIPVGTPTADSPFAGDGTFTPHVIASNLSSRPQTLTVTPEYPKAASWNSANGPGGPAAPQVRFGGVLKKGEKDPNEALDHPSNPDPSLLTGQYTLAPLTIGPDSTVDFSLASVTNQFAQPVPYASVRIRYTGPPGSIVAQVASVDESQDLVVDARTANELDGWAGSGANPWHVDSQTDSILFLTDEGDKPARIGFSITAGGVHYYLTSLQLAPGETRAINIRDLRDAQAADFQGNKIPAGAADGSVDWVRLDSVPVEGRLIVIQKRLGMASNYDCSTCYCPAVFRALSVAPGAFGLIPLAYENLGSTATYYSCNTGTYYSDVTAGSSWSSNNTPVIKMDSSVHYRADAVSVGTAAINGGYSDCTQYDTNPDLNCPCINYHTYAASGAGLTYTAIQHNYPRNPLANPCFISSFFDAVRGDHVHKSEDVVYDDGTHKRGVIPPYGSPVYAMEAGTVVVAQGNNGPAPEGYPACNVLTGTHAGNYVKIQTSDNYFTIYFHVHPSVSTGQSVTPGQQIGTLDNSGCQSHAHLHVARKNPSNVPVNFTLPCANQTPVGSFYDGLVDDWVPDDL
ncbi:MAG TPA: M23 family metallopeptidase [Terriglobia bacterium]|nr:M23 family metallopeptidase [Terriglobia bacterium]